MLSAYYTKCYNGRTDGRWDKSLLHLPNVFVWVGKSKFGKFRNWNGVCLGNLAGIMLVFVRLPSIAKLIAVKSSKLSPASLYIPLSFAAPISLSFACVPVCVCVCSLKWSQWKFNSHFARTSIRLPSQPLSSSPPLRFPLLSPFTHTHTLPAALGFLQLPLFPSLPSTRLFP